jgi:hypothetical protein
MAETSAEGMLAHAALASTAEAAKPVLRELTMRALASIADAVRARRPGGSGDGDF